MKDFFDRTLGRLRDVEDASVTLRRFGARATLVIFEGRLNGNLLQRRTVIDDQVLDGRKAEDLAEDFLESWKAAGGGQ